ncbi:MAG: T9SS type A sorting domain-containing protein [Candidatus Marinimicrobia bacterium]|nr:T9SS type A sorting domain-containing protein [Candidatus Neomarinimicrobiota bacterium]
MQKAVLLSIIKMFCILTALFASLEATEYFVSTASEITSTLKNVLPGDTLTLTNGTWDSQIIEFEADGTSSAPILMRAENPGQVILKGGSWLEISGNWLIVDGLCFLGGYSTGHSVIEFRGDHGRAHNCRLTNSAIIDYNPANKDTDYKWVGMYGQNNRVDHCHFEGKEHSGTTFVIWLTTEEDRNNYHLIDHNYFGSRPDLGYNGGETIRIGTSDHSMTDSYSIVEYNVFEECDGETEIISNKSCENTYRYNTFRKSIGTLTLRHGNRCYVYSNYFFGEKKYDTGGVRIIGEDHQVYNNYFQDLNGSGYKSALTIVEGVENSPLNRYFQVKNTLVAFNTFVNCNNVFKLGYGTSDDQTLPPINCTIANNAVYSQDDAIEYGDDESKPVDFKWEGNIMIGDYEDDDPGGIVWVDPKLVYNAEDSIYRPADDSPLLNAAVGAYDVPFDIDGQTRTTPFEVGCDEQSSEAITNRPLSKKDVGIHWEIIEIKNLYVDAAENNLQEAIEMIGEQDTIFLTTSGGVYEVDNNIPVNKKVTILANTEEKPIITRKSDSNPDACIFEMKATGNLNLDGVILDDSNKACKSLIASSHNPFSQYYKVKLNNCTLQNVQDGQFLLANAGTKADSLIFTHCTFASGGRAAFKLNSEAEGSALFNTTYLELNNCTFWNIAEEAVSIYGGDSVPFTFGPSVKINHCTFDHCGNDGWATLNLREIDLATVTNSIFTNCSPNASPIALYGWSYIEYCDIYNCDSLSLNRGANIKEGMVSVDPGYRNSAAGDFTLGSHSPVYGLGNDGLSLGDLRWVDESYVALEHEEEFAEACIVAGNYPNPFNGTTKIFYTISEGTRVKIGIYNLQGQNVFKQSLVHKQAGKYLFDWSPVSQPSGIYYCKITTEARRLIWPMLYIK